MLSLSWTKRRLRKHKTKGKKTKSALLLVGTRYARRGGCSYEQQINRRAVPACAFLVCFVCFVRLHVCLPKSQLRQWFIVVVVVVVFTVVLVHCRFCPGRKQAFCRRKQAFCRRKQAFRRRRQAFCRRKQKNFADENKSISQDENKSISQTNESISQTTTEGLKKQKKIQ